MFFAALFLRLNREASLKIVFDSWQVRAGAAYAERLPLWPSINPATKPNITPISVLSFMTMFPSFLVIAANPSRLPVGAFVGDIPVQPGFAKPD